MHEFLTQPPITLALAAIILALVACYGLGRLHGSPVYVAYAGLPAVAETTTDPIAEAAEAPGTVEVGLRIVRRNEGERFMPDFNALPALAAEPDPLESSAAQALMDEKEELSAEVIELRDQVHWLEATKARALRRAAIDRARVRVILTDVWERPRRAPKEKLSAEVIEIGSRRAPLVPPAIARTWKEESA